MLEAGARQLEPQGAAVAIDVWSPLPFQQLPDAAFLREVPGGWRFHPQVVNHPHQVVPSERSPDEFRVVVVGGSTAAGDGLPFGEGPVDVATRTLAAQLPDREVRVLNLGRSGWSSNQVATVLEASIDRLDPDVVLAFLGNNERGDIVNVVAAEGAAGPVLRARWLRRRFALARLVEPLPPPPPDPDAPGPVLARRGEVPDRDRVEAYALRRLDRGLNRIHRTTSERGIGLVMTTMAVNWRYQRDREEHYFLARVPALGPVLLEAEAARATGNPDPALEARLVDWVRALPRSGLDAERAIVGAWIGQLTGATTPDAMIAALGSPVREGGEACVIADIRWHGGDRAAAATDYRACFGTQMYYRADDLTNERLRAIADRLEVPVVDLDREVREASEFGVPDYRWFKDYCHYNAAGAAFVGPLLAAGVAPR